MRRVPPTRPGTVSRRGVRAAAAAAAAVLAVVVPSAQAGVSVASGDGTSTQRSAKHDPRLSALAEVVVRARSGVVVPPGAIAPASLTKNRPAEILVTLGPDPLGLAAALRVDPAGFWEDARADVIASGPGFSARGRIGADGSARLSVIPPSPGPVQMRMFVPARSIYQALGRPTGQKWTRHWIPGANHWEKGLGAALVRPGELPGSAVLEVEDLPVPPPDPGGEPAPEPAPSPGPEPAP